MPYNELLSPTGTLGDFRFWVKSLKASGRLGCCRASQFRLARPSRSNAQIRPPWGATPLEALAYQHICVTTRDSSFSGIHESTDSQGGVKKMAPTNWQPPLRFLGKRWSRIFFLSAIGMLLLIKLLDSIYAGTHVRIVDRLIIMLFFAFWFFLYWIRPGFFEK